MQTCVSHEELLRIGEFLEHLHNTGRKPKTILTYTSAHRALMGSLADLLGRPADLTLLAGVHLRQWRDREIERGRRPATVNLRLGFLRMYTTWAREREIVGPQQAAMLLGVSDVATQALAPRGLSPEELARLVGTVESRGSARDRAIFSLLLHGLRLSEVAGLTVNDVTLGSTRGRVCIRGSHVKASKYREVPLGAEARRHVAAYLQERGASDGSLFVGKRGALGDHGIYLLIRKWGRACGVSVSPHRLRHTFAQRFLRATNNDLAGLQQLLGHASVAVTGRYAQRRMEELECAVAASEI